MSPRATSDSTASPPARRAHRLREVVLPGILATGDALCALGGLVAGYGMRYHTPIAEWGVPVPGATLQLYLPLLLVGAVLLVATYVYLGLYDPRLLLRRVFSLGLIMKGMAFWIVAYLGLSLVLKFEPPISRLFVLVAFGTTLVITYAWRNAFFFAITRPVFIDRIKQRVAVLGDDTRTRSFLQEISHHRAHPFAAAGYIAQNAPESAPSVPVWLGRWEDLEEIIRRDEIDIIVVGSLELPHEAMGRIIETCERTYTEWKVIPSAFELFVSNLQLETHGGVPVLGVGPLAVRRLFNRVLKRALDLVGAAVGLLLSLPVMMVAALLVRRESPGPVLFRQTRIGAHHRPFTMFKLRTMRVGADAEDDARQSTTTDDPRVLRTGRFLRRWNLDELPQFWNVLRGDMSLVGPRPERPYHVDQLSDRIRHYLPRHLVKPGMTGWAQVNGCRGEGDLERRIQHDIYYIENWSPLLDLQIIVLTFLRWRAPE
jgi:exopolysaccharide biosynthesis polyprenyl glycosylphosphotransferase